VLTALSVAFSPRRRVGFASVAVDRISVRLTDLLLQLLNIRESDRLFHLFQVAGLTMKTVVIIALIVAGVCAEVPPFQCTSSSAFVCKFQEIGHNIKHHAIDLGGKLADIGMNILDATISQGTDILVQGTKGRWGGPSAAKILALSISLLRQFEPNI